jgi:hypothetical protein
MMVGLSKALSETIKDKDFSMNNFLINLLMSKNIKMA